MTSEGTMLVKKAVGSHRGKQNRRERQQDGQKNEKPCSVTELISSALAATWNGR